jgi:hypothetical protein
MLLFKKHSTFVKILDKLKEFNLNDMNSLFTNSCKRSV